LLYVTILFKSKTVSSPFYSRCLYSPSAQQESEFFSLHSFSSPSMFLLLQTVNPLLSGSILPPPSAHSPFFPPISSVYSLGFSFVSSHRAADSTRTRRRRRTREEKKTTLTTATFLLLYVTRLCFVAFAFFIAYQKKERKSQFCLDIIHVCTTTYLCEQNDAVFFRRRRRYY
jgi:hypothetical protein